MKTKTISTLDETIIFAVLVFFGYVAFLAVSEEGFRGGLLIVAKIFGMALGVTLVGMIVVGFVVWAVMAWKKNKRIREIEREVFSQMILENPHKKKGYQPNCEGPNKWAR